MQFGPLLTFTWHRRVATDFHSVLRSLKSIRQLCSTLSNQAEHFQTKATVTELNTCSIKPLDTQLPTCETAECNQVVQLTANGAVSHVRVLALSRSLFACRTPPLSPEGLHMLQCARLNSEAGSSRNLLCISRIGSTQGSQILPFLLLAYYLGAQRELFQVLVILSERV